MPLIGSGSYGCVYQPELSCKGKIAIYQESDNEGISKLILKEDAKKEIEINKMVLNYDPDGFFHVPIKSICYNPIYEKDKCNKKLEGELISLQYQYGGVPLNKLKKKLKIDESFLVALWRLFYGVLTLNKNGIYHMDIKPENILFDNKNGIDDGVTPLNTQALRLIDFGISIQKDSIKYKQPMDLFNVANTLGVVYVYWPNAISLLGMSESMVQATNFGELNKTVNYPLLFQWNEIYLNSLKAMDREARYTYILERADIYSLAVSILEILGIRVKKSIDTSAIKSETIREIADFCIDVIASDGIIAEYAMTRYETIISKIKYMYKIKLEDDFPEEMILQLCYIWERLPKFLREESQDLFMRCLDPKDYVKYRKASKKLYDYNTDGCFYKILSTRDLLMNVTTPEIQKKYGKMINMLL